MTAVAPTPPLLVTFKVCVPPPSELYQYLSVIPLVLRLEDEVLQSLSWRLKTCPLAAPEALTETPFWASAAHWWPHDPELQTRPEVHLLPQVPQFCGSLARVAQAPVQQVWPVVQAVPQAPQFFTSLVKSVQA